MGRHLFVLGIGLGLAIGAGCTRQNTGGSPGTESSPSGTNTYGANDRQNVGGGSAQTGEATDETGKSGQPSGLGSSERQPVAGREVQLDNELKNKLGDKWSVSAQGQNVVATRTKVNPPGKDLAKDVQDKIRSVHSHDKGLTASYEGGDSVTVRGTSKDCTDAASQLKDIADIDGINRITATISCVPKQP